MIVLDSSFVIAYYNTRDAHHGAAARTMVHLAAGQWGQALLLEYVVLEIVTVLRARRNLDVAVDVATKLLSAREIDFVPCSDFFLESLDAFRRQASGEMSFTDSAIATVARRHRPGYVATFDADFRDQPGLRVIPE